jgi:S1-C subfamily serine protease
MDQVVSAVAAKKPGDSVTIELLRDGRTRTVTAKLAKRPSEAPPQQ